MNIEIVKVGELECNCYLLEINNKLLVIDPGDNGDKIIKKIGNREVVGIIITHYHFDHIGAIDDLVNKYNVLVYDKNNMSKGINKIDNFIFDIIYTPGHKEDCISIYFREDNVMFVGDFIFKDCVGRCDLTGGSIKDMIDSINMIKKYDKDIVIYPGHGDNTTLEHEINNNRYFFDVDYI